MAAILAPDVDAAPANEYPYAGTAHVDCQTDINAGSADEHADIYNQADRDAASNEHSHTGAANSYNPANGDAASNEHPHTGAANSYNQANRDATSNEHPHTGTADIYNQANRDAASNEHPHTGAANRYSHTNQDAHHRCVRDCDTGRDHSTTCQSGNVDRDSHCCHCAQRHADRGASRDRASVDVHRRLTGPATHFRSSE